GVTGRAGWPERRLPLASPMLSGPDQCACGDCDTRTLRGPARGTWSSIFCKQASMKFALGNSIDYEHPAAMCPLESEFPVVVSAGGCAIPSGLVDPGGDRFPGCARATLGCVVQPLRGKKTYSLRYTRILTAPLRATMM